MKSFIEEIPSFSIEVDSSNLKGGKVSGYDSKAFYFAITDKKGGKFLKKIRSGLEEIVSQFQPTGFSPHLTVANAIPGIEERVIQEAEIKLEESFKIKIPVTKIRLTEIVAKPDGQMVYKSKHYFFLRSK